MSTEPTPTLPRVTLAADELPVGTVLAVIAKAGGLRLEIGRDVDPGLRVSLDLSEVPVDEAARLVVGRFGWDATVTRDRRLHVTGTTARAVQLRFPDLRRAFTSRLGGETLGSSSTGGASTGGTAGTGSGSSGSSSSSGSQSSAPSGGSSALSGTVQVTYDLSAKETWETVENTAKAIIGEGGTVTVQRETGTVWLRGRPADVTEAARQLEAIDRELSRQVFLDVSVMDVTVSDRTRYGIDWTKVFRLGHAFGGATPWGTLTLAQPMSTIATGISSTAFTATLARADRPDQLILRALEEQGRARLLSQPKLLVLNGQTALLSVGEVVPFVSSIQQSVVGTSGTIVTTPVIGQAQSGLTIAITPRIQGDEVTFHLSPVVNEITSFKTFTVAGASFENPVIASKALTTVARAESGETILLGGLIDTQASTQGEGLPLLSRIPVLGVLFKSQDIRDRSRELVIVITPSLDRAPQPLSPGSGSGGATSQGLSPAAPPAPRTERPPASVGPEAPRTPGEPP